MGGREKLIDGEKVGFRSSDLWLLMATSSVG